MQQMDRIGVPDRVEPTTESGDKRRFEASSPLPPLAEEAS